MAQKRAYTGFPARGGNFNPSFSGAPAIPPKVKPANAEAARLKSAQERAKKFKVGQPAHTESLWPASVLEVDEEKGMLKLGFEPYFNSLALIPQKPQVQSPQWISALMVDHRPEPISTAAKS
jgi:hypothetical protein